MIVTTLTYAGILGLVMALLSIRVPMRRATLNAPWGDGDDDILATRVRVFGNFIEYVPYVVLLMGLVELSGGQQSTLHFCGLSLVVARLLHAVALHRRDDAIWRKLFRAVGAMTTWLVLLSLAVYALMLGVPQQ